MPLYQQISRKWAKKQVLVLIASTSVIEDSEKVILVSTKKLE